MKTNVLLQFAIVIISLLGIYSCEDKEVFHYPPYTAPRDGRDILSVELSGVISKPQSTDVYIVFDPTSDVDLSDARPSFTLSEKASIIPASGTSVDFSNGKVIRYTVTSETGLVKEYSLSAYKAPIDIMYVCNGEFRKNSKAYYGIGVNFFELYRRIYHEDIGSKSTLTGLETLAANGIPFVRFPGPFSEGDWRDEYVNNVASYYAWMDEIVRKAESLGIMLIPSLFWNVESVVQLNNESWNAYKDDYSSSIDFIKRYTTEFVTRYKDSKAILGWEFGNEFSLLVDYSHEAPTNECMTNAFEEFGKAVRAVDPIRPIFSGNTEPRYAAHSLWKSPNKDWIRDTPQQYRFMINKFECDPINTITIRGYYDEAPQHQPMGIATFSDFLDTVMTYSKEINKPIFVGEFGSRMQKSHVTEADLKPMFENRLQAILSNKVQLSAIWVYDRPGSEDDKTNTTFTHPERKYVMEGIRAANQTMQSF